MDTSQSLSYAEIRNTILNNVPPEIGITRIEFEGPRLAIYTQKPEILAEQTHIVAEIAGKIKKRIVVRSDPSVRTREIEAERIVKEILKEAGLVQSYFDPTMGEVILEVEKPGVAIGKGGSNLVEIVKQTRWNPSVVRSPPIPSLTIKQIRGYLYSKSKEREKFLRETGESIFRPIFDRSGDVRVTFLGSARQVGRSAVLIRSRESCVLLDCGINPGSRRAVDAYPRFDVEEFGGGSIRIAAVPALVNMATCETTVRALAQDLEGLDQGSAIDEALRRVAATTACHAAVKAHDRLTPEKMVYILDELRRTEHSSVCPHGRPVILRLSRREIEKRFDRI